MINSIYNFYSYSNKLAAGGQPTADQISSLKNEGYEAIVNISPVSARNFLAEEAALTEKQGFVYVHFPVDCSNLQDHHYPMFKTILNNLKDKKTFVHCGGNIKTSNLIHMYKVLELKQDESASVAELKKIQNPEAKWFPYFKKFGMQGIS